MITCQHFGLKELLPPDLYHELESKNQLWRGWYYLDARVLITIDALRKKFGSAFMNTWGLSQSIQSAYGRHQWRGYRPQDCKIGSTTSDHKFGRAADIVFRDYTAQEVRDYVLANPEEFPYIKIIEDDVSWFHFSVNMRNLDDTITVIKP